MCRRGGSGAQGKLGLPLAGVSPRAEGTLGTGLPSRALVWPDIHLLQQRDPPTLQGLAKAPPCSPPPLAVGADLLSTVLPRAPAAPRLTRHRSPLNARKGSHRWLVALTEHSLCRLTRGVSSSLLFSFASVFAPALCHSSRGIRSRQQNRTAARRLWLACVRGPAAVPLLQHHLSRFSPAQMTNL